MYHTIRNCRFSINRLKHFQSECIYTQILLHTVHVIAIHKEK
uniref:Uncharacterized protein n=1 Tax=Anguilla anguilla TaxID=7936 RepID=A0A0E9VSY2_ANGAN